MGRLAGKVDKAFAGRNSRVVEVPEWGETLTVFPLTLGQLSAINAEKDQMRKLVRTILVRAKKPDGLPLFDEEDGDKLFTHGVGVFGPDVVIRVVTEINFGDSFDDDEAAAEKK